MAAERSETFPDSLESQDAFPVNLKVNVDTNVLLSSGKETFQKLAVSAEVRLCPQVMGSRVTAAEEMTIQAKFERALYELGILTQSDLLARTRLAKPPKPFNLTTTVSRFFEQSTQTVLPAIAVNLLNGFPRLFMDDAETARIRRMPELQFTTPVKPTDIALVLETPGIELDDFSKTQQAIASFGQQRQYDLKMRSLDLPTALQIAFQKRLSIVKQGSPTILLTDRKTHDGNRIAVSSIPMREIALREVRDTDDAVNALRELVHTTLPVVSTSAVFRQLI